MSYPGFAQRWLGCKSDLRRTLNQLSKSSVRTQRDDLKVEQSCLDHRKCSEELLRFRHILTFEAQHDPWLVVRAQIELAHQIAFVELPYICAPLRLRTVRCVPT